MKKIVNKYGVSILFILIVCIGSYLRFRGVIDQSFAYTYDVGRDMLALEKIVVHKDIPLIGPTTGLPGLFYGPWWYYFLVPAFILGGGDPRAIAACIALTGIATIILGFFLGKKLYNAAFGVLFAGVLAFSFTLVRLTSQIWNPNLAPFFLLLVYWLLYLFFLDKRFTSKNELLTKVLTFLQKKSLILLLLGFFAGISIDAEIVYGILLCGGVSVFMLYYLSKQKRLTLFFYYLLGVGIVFLPRIVFEIRHDFVMTNHLLSLIKNQEISQASIVLSVLAEFRLVLVALKALWDETIAFQHPLLGYVFVLFTLGAIMRFFKQLSELVKLLVSFSLVTLALYLMGLSFFRGDIWSHYIVGLPVVFIFLFCVAIFEVLKRTPYKLFGWTLVFVLFFIYINPAEIVSYHRQNAYVGDASLYRNQVGVIDYIYLQAAGKDFNYTVYTPPVRDYTYQYLFSWYGKKKYGYVPSAEKQPEYYYIIEPDTLYEYRLVSWLESRKDDGQILYKTVLPGGIRIQKRTH